MRALVLTAYKRLELTELPPPEVGEDEVLVRVGACGICGSDVHGYDGSSGRRIPPLVMGHEAAGTVERVGSRVSGLGPGDRVTLDSTVYCGRCAFCRSGRANLCDERRVLGVSCGEYRRHGCFAEYVAVPARGAHRLPEDLPLEQAALVEPVAVAVHAVGRSGVTATDTAVVVGSGMIGLLVIQALRAAGCRSVVAVDVDPAKLEWARRFGAWEAFASGSAAAELRRLTGGRGADVALDCVGVTESLLTAVACARKGGALTLVGNITPSVGLPLQAVVASELTLLGTCASNGEYPRAIELMRRGEIDVRPLISRVAPLAEGPSLFDRLYAREPGLMKVVLQP
jgi:L-iditol 2-dehydrogenase